ncbi:MAG: SHOCT domain-containing protein [Acidimicrobiia bacterium]
MWWWHDGWGWGGWLLMVVGNVVFWGLVLWAVVALVPVTGPGREATQDPEGVLATRFAAGEIDQDEYERRLDALRGVGSDRAGIGR